MPGLGKGRADSAVAGPEGSRFRRCFGDIFSDIFGGGARGGRNAVYPGPTCAYSMEITLEQAAEGLATEIRVPSWGQTCETCSGSGLSRVPAPDLRYLRRCGQRAHVPGVLLDQQTWRPAAAPAR